MGIPLNHREGALLPMLWSWNKEYNVGIYEVRFDGASPSARTFKRDRCKTAKSKLQKQMIYTVKPVLVVTSIKQAACTCIKQACNQFPKQANTLICTCIKRAPVLCKQILIVP